MGLENLKNLSPKLFNDRVKKFKNTPKHAPDGTRVLQPGIQHLTGHSTLDDLQYQETVFGRTFIPNLKRLGPTLYSPQLPGWPMLLGMDNTNIEDIYFGNSSNDIVSPTFQRVDSEIGEDKYGVGIRDSQSPMSNTEDFTTSDDPILDGSPEIDGAYLLNNYSRYGNISIEHNPFVVDNEPHYDQINYGYNTYKGTSLDDGIGGIFNQLDNYSSVFGKITTPLGYGESPVGNDILGRGNSAPIGGDIPGSGYQDRLDLLNTYTNTRETGKPSPYVDSTSTAEGNINLSSFYYYGGQPTNYIPFLNKYVEGSTDGKGGRVFGGDAPIEKRKVPLNFNITGQTIKSMDQHTLLFGGKLEQRVTDNKKIEVVGQKLSLQDAAYNSGFRQSIFKAPKGSSGFLSDIKRFLGGNNTTGGEPYMIYSNDEEERSKITAGRELPWNQMARDAGRFIKFQTSMAGLLFFGRQTLLGMTARPNPIVQPDVMISAPPSAKERKMKESAIGKVAWGTHKFLPLPQKYRPFYNPVSTLAQIVTSGLIGAEGSSFVRFERDMWFPNGKHSVSDNYIEYMKNVDKGINLWEDGLWYRHQLSNREANRQIGVSSINSVRTSIDPTKQRGSRKGFGDFMTVMELNKASKKSKTLSEAHPTDGINIESSQHGMPFYFYDMRTNQYLIFRAYIEGLTENIAPQWNSERYLGRSEPVYTYVGAERDVSFTLKLFAQTRFELNAIYKKLNRLTSLCYPEYKLDTNFSTSFTRMKPPLTKMRLGELYGSADYVESGKGKDKKVALTNKDLMGFIKSISYSVPDDSPWEIARGKRVPKYITCALTYQIIHDETPNMNTKFYGFTGVSSTTEGYYKSDQTTEGKDGDKYTAVDKPWIGDW